MTGAAAVPVATPVYVAAARRTAVVPQKGAFRRLRIEDLAAPVIMACLADAGLAPAAVDEVIVSNALGAGGNPARRVALAAGLPDRVAGLSIDRQCAGGLDAILLARALVAAGLARVVVAGGVESHSLRPQRLAADPDGGPPRPYDQAPFTPWPDRDPGMAEAAAALAARLGISRAAQEDWAIRSHARAAAGPAPAEIVAVEGQLRDPFGRDLGPELAARGRVLAGSVTTTTTAVAADGAAFCVVTAAPGPVQVLGGVTLGGQPDAPGLAPVAAIEATLGAAGLRPQDLTMVELMEAFAVQAIACQQAAGLDPARMNLRGGALARGHPIGASGAVLAVRLFHDLRAEDGPGRYGLAAIASAGGVGSALLLGRGKGTPAG